MLTKRIEGIWQAAIVVAVLAIAAVVFTVHRAPAQLTISSPTATNTVVGTSSTQIVAANPGRKALSICNGANATNSAAVAPAGLTPTIGATGLGVAIAPAACFTSPANALSAGAAWNGIGAASGQQIIVLEWF